MMGPMAKEYKDTIINKAESLVTFGFPEKITNINKILDSKLFADRNLADMLQALNIPIPESLPEPRSVCENGVAKPKPATKFYSSSATCNTKICDFISVAKPVIRALIEDANLLKMWISFLVPKVEDGNSFCVEIQESILSEIEDAETDAATFFNRIPQYFVSRAAVIAKVSDHPYVEDYRRAVQEMDEQAFLSLWLALSEIRNHYCSLHDIIIKNFKKLKAPLKSHVHSLY